VAEIEGYQKIIDGARQVMENNKPRIKVDEEWEVVEFNKVCSLEYGESLTEKDRIAGEYPVLGSNGITG
jgi:type I restriction enzyme M protein